MVLIIAKDIDNSILYLYTQMKKSLFLILIIFIIFSSFGLQKKKKNWDIEKIKEGLLEEGYYTISDTLMDIDGDEIQDLIITTRVSIMYPPFSFLYRGSVMKDTTEYIFINPTYSITDNIVRCVYGDCDGAQGGYMVLEKYKWSQIGVDTLERYFVPDVNEKEDFTRYKDYTIINKENIPVDYKETNGFDFYYRFIRENINE